LLNLLVRCYELVIVHHWSLFTVLWTKGLGVGLRIRRLQVWVLLRLLAHADFISFELRALILTNKGFANHLKLLLIVSQSRTCVIAAEHTQ